MKSNAFLLSCALLLLPAISGAQQDDMFTALEYWKAPATVRVIVVDQFGRNIPEATVSAFTGWDKEDYASQFRDHVATGIPKGNYRIRVELPGFRRAERQANVILPETLVVVGLVVGSIADPLWRPLPRTLKGRVTGRPIPANRHAFVKVMGVFSDYSIEAEIGSGGEFVLAEPVSGINTLMVISEDGVLASQVIDIRYGIREIEIEVREQPVIRFR